MDSSAEHSEPLVSEEHPHLFHYTSEAGLYGILDSQELWATHFEYLNDREEFRAAKSLLRPEMIRAVERTTKRLIAEGKLHEPPDVAQLVESEADRILDILYMVTLRVSIPFVFSFCAHHADSAAFHDGLLSQWRGYGRSGGYAIQFSTEETEELLQSNSNQNSHGGYALAQVVYGPGSADFKYLEKSVAQIAVVADALIVSLIEGSNPKETVDRSYLPFVQFVSRIKHAGFSEENEIRLIHFVPKNVPKDRKPGKAVEFREQRGERVPFVKLFSGTDLKLPIKRIIVGPHPRAETRCKTLELFLDRRGMSIETSISRLPYLPE